MNLDFALTVLNNCLIGTLVVAAALGFFRIIYFICGFIKNKPLKETDQMGNYAILIPARNESKVIGRLLDSIKKQDYKGSFKVFVIVESEEDKTCQITTDYGYNVFVRQHLELKGKGYALDEVYKYIQETGEKFDAYFIFDADNVLAPNFITEMNKAYFMGYKIANGYRAQINKPGNWVADCSALTFSGQNTFQNKARTMLTKNITISGTGFYVSADVLEKSGGYNFHTFTEDYELSLFASLNDFKSAYIPSAVFYDEQPTTLKTLNKQRPRWIRGYFDARNLYAKRALKKVFSKKCTFGILDHFFGVTPNIMIIATTIAYTITNIGFIIYALIIGSNLWLSFLISLLILWGGNHVFLMLYAVVQLCAEQKYLRHTFWSALKVVLFNPFFTWLFVPHAIKALTSKNITWAPIEHGTKNTIMEAKNEEK